MRRINVSGIVGASLLAGSELARKHLPLFVAAAMAGEKGETVVWDWSGVDLATSSYFAKTVLPLFRMTTSNELDIYSIMIGLNQNSLEELQVVLMAESYAALVADKIDGKRVKGVKIVGQLDTAHDETLREVMRRKRVSASALHSSFRGKKRPGKTAWINRLVALNKLGLVRRRRVGREFVYEPAYVEA